MHLLAISGSLRPGSTNSALLRAWTALAPAGVEVTLYEGLVDLPPFDPGLELDPADYRAPAPVVGLRDLLKDADGLLLCTPEYAFGMPGVLKNLLDWTVDMGVMEGKPVGVLAASPLGRGPLGEGGSRAHQGLVWVLTALGMRQVPEASLVVSQVRRKLDGEGRILDPDLAIRLQAALDALLREAAKTP